MAAGKSAAEKVAAENAAAEKAAAEKVAAEKAAAETAAAEKAAAVKAAAVKAALKSEEAEAEKAATEKVASEKEDDEKKAIVVKSDFVASTSCIGKKLPEWNSCWNCEGEMSTEHQCDSPVDTSGMSKPASTSHFGLPALAEPSFKGMVTPSLPLRLKVPGPSAPVILKKPVKMLDGSLIWK